MADHTVRLKQGFNYISVPLDMSGVSYEDNPNILFDPSLQTNFNPLFGGFYGEYSFVSVSNSDQTITNYTGQWEDSIDWTNITTADGLVVFCNLSPSTEYLEKTFSGARITDPTAVLYDLVVGWNYISYPYSIKQQFGLGSYSSNQIDFAITTDYLAGSGHANATISKVAQVFDNGSFRSIEHDGSGSNSSDWTGSLEGFEPSYGVFLYCDSAVSDASVWDNSTETDDQNYNYLLGTTGVTTLNANGDRGFACPSVDQGIYAPNYTPEQVRYRINWFNHDAGTTEPFTWKVKKSNGDDILKVDLNGDGLGGNDYGIITTGSVAYQLGFFVDRYFNKDTSRPNWGNRGYISQFGRLATGGENMVTMLGIQSSPSYSTLTDATVHYGMEHDDSGGDVPIYLSAYKYEYISASYPSATFEGIWSFNLINGGKLSYPFIHLVRDTTSSGDSGIDIADIGTLKSVTGFTTGDLIVPVIYDPDASDGERYRLCKYYPHKDDYFYEPYINDWGGTSTRKTYFRDQPKYRHIFYDVAGNLKIDSAYGDPYIEPVYRTIPYEIRYTDGMSASAKIQFFWGGVLKML